MEVPIKSSPVGQGKILVCSQGTKSPEAEVPVLLFKYNHIFYISGSLVCTSQLIGSILNNYNCTQILSPISVGRKPTSHMNLPMFT